MRTKLFPDETAEALDELEYHPHHVHASAGRVTGAAGASGSAAGSPTPLGVPTIPSQAVLGGGVGAESSPGIGATGGGEGGTVGVHSAGEGEGGDDENDSQNSKSRGTGGTTMMQRMNKTFRPDPLVAYTGDRSTLRFKPRRQEGLTTLRPRQQRIGFNAAQISPMLQVRRRSLLCVVLWLVAKESSRIPRCSARRFFNALNFTGFTLRV